MSLFGDIVRDVVSQRMSDNGVDLNKWDASMYDDDFLFKLFRDDYAVFVYERDSVVYIELDSLGRNMFYAELYCEYDVEVLFDKLFYALKFILDGHCIDCNCHKHNSNYYPELANIVQGI